MRLIFAVVTFFFVVGQAQAKPNKKPRFEGRLLSYSQLMQLSSAKRTAYLQDVAKLLAHMEKSQSIYEIADNDIADMKEQVASLMRMMAVLPEANAQAGLAGGPSGRATELDCGDELTYSRYTRSCVTKDMLEAQQAEEAAREARKAADAAVSKQLVIIGSGNIGPDGLPIGTPRKGLPGAQAGTEATQDCGKTLKWSRYSHNCVNDQILSAQKEEAEAREARRIADQKVVRTPVIVGSGNIGPDGMPIGTPKVGQAGGPSGAEATLDCGKTLNWSRYSRSCVNNEILAAQKAEDEARTARVAADKAVAKDLVVVGSGQIGPDGRPIGEAKQGLPGSPSGPTEQVVMDKIAAAQKAEEAAREARKEADAKPAQPPPKQEQTGTSAPAEEKPTAATCEKPQFNCANLDQQAREQAITEFRSDSSTNVCIAGGYFSQYATPKKSVGTCQVQTKLERLNGGKPKECGQPADGKSRMAMCNPAVFCLGLKVDDKLKDLMKNDADVKKALPEAALNSAATDLNSKDKVLPIFLCAKVGQDLTEKCNQNLLDHVEGRASRFGKSKGEHYVACDSAMLKDFPLQNEYRALREGIENRYRAQCNNSQDKFTALFCTECKIIADRIMAMNIKATGEPCPAGTPAGSPPPSDGAADAIREKGS